MDSCPLSLREPPQQAADWKTSSEESGGSTLSGKLYRNSADQNGSAPYLLLDKWGVVRGYVAAAQGVDLESSVGQQVSLQGTIRTLPGGDMPYMTCEKVARRRRRNGRRIRPRAERANVREPSSDVGDPRQSRVARPSAEPARGPSVAAPRSGA